MNRVVVSRRSFLAGTAAGIAGGLASTHASAAAAPAPRPAADHVILVDWDGFDPEFLTRAQHPAVDALAARGARGLATNTYSTFSNSCRSSMSTGAYPEVHDNAGYYYDVVADRAVSQNRDLEAETIAEALARQGRSVASVQWYMVQDHGTTYGDPSHLYVQPGGSFATTARVAIDILNRRPVSSGGKQVTVPEVPAFMAVYGADLDGLVHQDGAESPRIGPLLESMDGNLASLVQATRDVGIFDRTAFILTGDLSMSTWEHSIIDAVLEAVEGLGLRPEVVVAGRRAAPETEVVIVQGVRVATFVLRGAAATPSARRKLRANLAGIEHVSNVFDRNDLRRMRASGQARGPRGRGRGAVALLGPGRRQATRLARQHRRVAHPADPGRERSPPRGSGERCRPRRRRADGRRAPRRHAPCRCAGTCAPPGPRRRSWRLSG
ncbi:MAG: alkaline phosphatase family protein [Lapillicoccus sp.]